MSDRMAVRYVPGAAVLIIVVVLVLVTFKLDSHSGFNLWDEGFLWYGAQRVMRGEVPIRDFMAYDPGRYYWAAAVMALKGSDRLINLRIAIAVFQALGLFVGLRVIATPVATRLRDVIAFTVCAAVTQGLWMTPDYRVFDLAVTCILIGALTALVRTPRLDRYFQAGVVVGLAAVFGRNHGVYGLAGSLGVMIWLGLTPRLGPGFLKGGLGFTAGVILGFLPVLLMAALIQGFATAFIDSVLLLFRQGATNLPLPVPWPWTVNFASGSSYEVIRGLLIGMFFIATLVFGPVGLVWASVAKKRGQGVAPAFVACAGLALPYAHYAFSRADVEHLGAGIFPLLFGIIVLAAGGSRLRRWTIGILLLTTSSWVMIQDHPAWNCRALAGCVTVEITGSVFAIDPGTAGEIDLLRKLAATYAPAGETFIAAPFWPGAYAVLGRKAPMWEIYALFPASVADEQAEILRLKAANPRFAIILDLALDGRDELRFRTTHPLIYKYILDNSRPVNATPEPTFGIYEMQRNGQ